MFNSFRGRRRNMIPLSEKCRTLDILWNLNHVTYWSSKGRWKFHNSFFCMLVNFLRLHELLRKCFKWGSQGEKESSRRKTRALISITIIDIILLTWHYWITSTTRRSPKSVEYSLIPILVNWHTLIFQSEPQPNI